jgi:hypothetical protein
MITAAHLECNSQVFQLWNDFWTGTMHLILVICWLFSCFTVQYFCCMQGPGTALGAEMYFDETYANGDGTDSWCTTNQLFPVDVFYGQAYTIPPCDMWSCTTGYLEKPTFRGIHYKVDNGAEPPFCRDRNIIRPLLIFLCM